MVLPIASAASRTANTIKTFRKTNFTGIITTPLTTQWWGDRTFTIQDPYGYQLWFYQPVAEPRPPQGAKVV